MILTFDLDLKGGSLTLTHVTLDLKDYLKDGQMGPEITFFFFWPGNLDLDTEGQAWGRRHQSSDQRFMIDP